MKTEHKGKLHRNFQGYATHGDCDLLAFGVSAINSIANTFSQNHKTIEPYINAIENKKLPIYRGLTLTEDDLLRRAVINQLICHFSLDYALMGKQFNISFIHYFSDELKHMTQLADDGLLEMNQVGFIVKSTGRLLIRRICMVFDKYLKKPGITARYSSLI